jgi:hypothetical protein
MIIKRFAWMILGAVAVLFGVWIAFRPSVEKEAEPGASSQFTASDQILFSNWLAGVRAEGLSPVQYFSTNFGPNPPPEYQKAAENARKIRDQGANLVPFVVASLRHETDPELLQNLYYWLITTAVIDLYFRQDRPYDELLRRPDFPSALPSLRDNFIAEWDRGDFDAPEKRLKPVLESYRSVDPALVRERELWPGMYYGFFGLPVLIEEIAQFDSFYAYSTFLCLTMQMTLLSSEMKEASSPQETKVRNIQHWWSENHQKFTRLPALYNKIDGAVKAFPENPEERATEN